MTGTPLLETRALTKEFRGFRAVSEVDLTVARGTVHALVGPNGAGKTTLFNLLTGFLSPTSGTVVFDGQDITGKAPEQIAPLGIARSFQITSLFEAMTLREHLELALASPTGMGKQWWRSVTRMARFKDRAMELLEDVGLADRAGAPASSLAYGQKRALELAIAMALDPKLLLLDEPTAGMGIEDVDRTIALVKQLAAGPHRRLRRPQHARRRLARRHRHRAPVRAGAGGGILRPGPGRRAGHHGIPRSST